MQSTNLTVSNSPHIGSETKINTIMLDVVLALMPNAVAGTVFFGCRALFLMAVCVVSCVLFEFLWRKITRQPVTTGDLSAVVTGLLFSMTLPVTMPFWIAVTGSFFAIIIVKQFFGGLGKNFVNPALAARAFVLTSWPLHMERWVSPFNKNVLDAMSAATPLAAQRAGEQIPAYWNLFVGNVPGCIGETSVLAILIGLAYLLFRRVISARVPLVYIGTVAILAYAFGGRSLGGGDALFHVLSGGLMLGAVFMAADYTTTPITPKGQIIFALGCGVLTVVIRLCGGHPEGVTYAVLIMNIAAPLIDQLVRLKRYGRREEQ